VSLRGCNVIWYYSDGDSDDAVASKARATCQYIRQLHGNAAAISFPFYMDGVSSSAVGAGSNTPSPGQLAKVAEIAGNYGLRVTIRPLLDEQAFKPGGWRGTIGPADRDLWFASYGSFLDPYLRMADGSGLAQIDIGVELNSLAEDGRWSQLISAARAIYEGRIGFSNNWDVFQQGLLGPPSVDVRGLDAYFPVGADNAATTDTLAAAWIAWLDGTRKYADLSNVVLAEVGIAAQDGAFSRPNDWGDSSEPIDASVQQRWFTAAWRAMRHYGMAGIFYWMLDLNNPPGLSDPETGVPMLFVGRGDQAIAACFAEEADSASSTSSSGSASGDRSPRWSRCSTSRGW
jgi:hypothetical protein